MDLSNWPSGVALDGMEKIAERMGLGRRNKGSLGLVESPFLLHICEKMVLVSLIEEAGVWREIGAEDSRLGVVGT